MFYYLRNTNTLFHLKAEAGFQIVNLIQIESYSRNASYVLIPISCPCSLYGLYL